MPLLEVSGLSKSFDTVTVVQSVSLEAERGELMCLLGPSGSGKTTLLRLIAGIENADEGTVTFDGASVDGVPPQERGFGLMFQDLALFPHMDVFGNIAFGLRMQRLPRADVRQRVYELLALVDMAGYGQRRVHELSGGERQRVALARALAPAPGLLMLDEPLGALDRALRDSLQGQIRAILKEVGVTSIYVTHDRDEALAMADTLAFMDRGRIVQTGTPEEVFRTPADEFVARSVGFNNIFRGVARSRGGLLEVECDLGSLLSTGADRQEAADGGGVLVLIEEGGVQVWTAPPQGEGAVNVLSGRVAKTVFKGWTYELRVQVGSAELSCSVPRNTDQAQIAAGDEVWVVIDPAAVRSIGPG